MKYFLISLVLIFSINGCSYSGLTEKEYQRSNAASEKAHDKLDRE